VPVRGVIDGGVITMLWTVPRGWAVAEEWMSLQEWAPDQRTTGQCPRAGATPARLNPLLRHRPTLVAPVP